MKAPLTRIMLVTVLLVAGLSASAQNGQRDSTKLHRIELTDDTYFIGRIISNNGAMLVIRTSAIPRLEIPLAKIRSIREIDASSVKNGVYWFENPNPTRYLFGPSAINLRQGEGYFQNTYLFLNSFNIGVTDNISVGGGIELFTTMISIYENKNMPTFFLTPKVGFKIARNFHAGGGVLYMNSALSFNGARTNMGIAYGVATLGDYNHNFTTGLGWGFLQGKFAERPVITFSGMTRIGRKTALVTENWLVPVDNYYGVYSYGIRFFGEKIAVDLAFLNNPDIASGFIPGIPYVDFTVKF